MSTPSAPLDLLATNFGPEESKQLHKMLRDWAQGDPNSFPIHLALLTRAQWHAAATVPQSIQTAGDALSVRLGQAHKDFEAIVAKTHQKWAETEAVANQLKTQLLEAEQLWQQTKADLVTEREKLASARLELERRIERHDWVIFGAVLIGLVGVVGMVVR